MALKFLPLTKTQYNMLFVRVIFKSSWVTDFFHNYWEPFACGKIHVVLGNYRSALFEYLVATLLSPLYKGDHWCWQLKAMVLDLVWALILTWIFRFLSLCSPKHALLSQTCGNPLPEHCLPLAGHLHNCFVSRNTWHTRKCSVDRETTQT